MKLSQQLRQLINEMEAHDRKTLALLDDMIDRTSALMQDLDTIIEDENTNE